MRRSSVSYFMFPSSIKLLVAYIITIHCSIRLQGSAAVNMCTVAKGSAESYYEFGIHVWDMAAASVIVEEAGGILLDPTGKQLDASSLFDQVDPEITE